MSEAAEKLFQTIQDDLQWHRDLAAVLENKLDAMRHYDMSRLEALTIKEQRLMETISDNERKRREVFGEATREFFPERGRKLATASEFAKVLEEPHRSKLLVLTGMLREITEKIRRLNSVNSIASQKIMGHFDHIFQIIAKSGRDIGLYGKAGKKSFLEQNRLVDALA